MMKYIMVEIWWMVILEWKDVCLKILVCDCVFVCYEC